MERFYSEADAFLEILIQDLGSTGLLAIVDKIDHLCYRTSSLEDYERTKFWVSGFSRLLIESDVNGRPIATYKLHKPVLFREHSINVVEVPAPKSGRAVDRGFEHVECVTRLSFEEILRRFPALEFDRRGLSKKLNPELEISFGPRAAKFHHMTLEDVIRIEIGK